MDTGLVERFEALKKRREEVREKLISLEGEEKVVLKSSDDMKASLESTYGTSDEVKLKALLDEKIAKINEYMNDGETKLKSLEGLSNVGNSR